MFECPKCNTEYEPVGNHEDDAGEYTCDECGFVFRVNIEYDPVYETVCAEHEFGEWRAVSEIVGPCTKLLVGTSDEARFCRYCGHCELMSEGDGK